MRYSLSEELDQKHKPRFVSLEQSLGPRAAKMHALSKRYEGSTTDHVVMAVLAVLAIGEVCIYLAWMHVNWTGNGDHLGMPISSRHDDRGLVKGRVSRRRAWLQRVLSYTADRREIAKRPWVALTSSLSHQNGLALVLNVVMPLECIRILHNEDGWRMAPLAVIAYVGGAVGSMLTHMLASHRGQVMGGEGPATAVTIIYTMFQVEMYFRANSAMAFTSAMHKPMPLHYFTLPVAFVVGSVAHIAITRQPALLLSHLGGVLGFALALGAAVCFVFLDFAEHYAFGGALTALGALLVAVWLAGKLFPAISNLDIGGIGGQAGLKAGDGIVAPAPAHALSELRRMHSTLEERDRQLQDLRARLSILAQDGSPEGLQALRSFAASASASVGARGSPSVSRQVSPVGVTCELRRSGTVVDEGTRSNSPTSHLGQPARSVTLPGYHAPLPATAAAPTAKWDWA